MSGAVNDQQSIDFVKGIDVMLYVLDTTYTDSIIFKEKPRYITNTLDTMIFKLSNLKAGKYRMIALKDNNFNKIYDPLSDKIGFVGDTVVIPTDSVYNFNIFKEVPELKVTKPKEVNMGHLIFGYYGNATDLKIELLTETSNDISPIIYKEQGKDTLNYWFKPFEADSLNFKVSKNDYTEEFVLKPRSNEIDSLQMNNSTGSTLHLLDTFSFTSNTPIVTVDESLIQIMNKDSAYVAFKTFLSESKTQMYISFEKQESDEYTLEMLPYAVSDIFGTVNDSINANFKTLGADDYGIINYDLITSKETALIAELLDDKDKTIRRVTLSEPGSISFTHLPPGNYNLKVIIDVNGNGTWDTGNFLMRRQPEIIKYFEKEIELRANYDINEVFILD